MVLLYLYWLWLCVWKRFYRLRRKHQGWRRKLNRCYSTEQGKTDFRAVPKPPWVRREIIRLKALMPGQSCRKLAATFNRLHKDQKQMTVGKTFVANMIRDHQFEIQVLRRKIKHRKPPITRKNNIWQVDLTGKTTEEEPRQSILGVIDHGCRACISMCALPNKSSIRILITLLEAMEQLGKPKTIRTDNEAVFTSKLFKLVLWLLGIKHQQTELHCPATARDGGR